MRYIIVLVFVVSLTSGYKKKSGNSITWRAIFKGFESFVHNGVLPLELPIGNGEYFRVELPLHPEVRGQFPESRIPINSGQIPDQMSPVDRRAFPLTDHGTRPVGTPIRANRQSPMGSHDGNNVINQVNGRVLPQGVHSMGVNQRPRGALPGNSQFNIGTRQIPVGMSMDIPQNVQFPLEGVANNNIYPVKEREWTGQMPGSGRVNQEINPMSEQFPMETPAGVAPNGRFPARPNVNMNIRNPIARGDFPGRFGNGHFPGIINPGNIQIHQIAEQFPMEMPIDMAPNGQIAPGTDIGNNMINPIDRAHSPGSFIPSRRRPRPSKFNLRKNHEMTNAITPPVNQLSSPENNFPVNSIPTTNMINQEVPVIQPEGMQLPNAEILPNIQKPEHNQNIRVLPLGTRPIDRRQMQSAINPNTNSLFPAHTPGSNPIIRGNQNQPLPRRTGINPGEWLRPDGNNLIPGVPQPDRGIIRPSEQLSSWWPRNGGNIGVPFHPDYFNSVSHINGHWKRMWKKKGGY